MHAVTMTTSKMLLLDLDGVVVLECSMRETDRPRIVLLHEDLPRRLASLEMRVVVLTHRSRREARRILEVAGLSDKCLSGVFAAEDLLLAGLSPAAFLDLTRRGLRKSLIVPRLRSRFGIEPHQLAFVDDVQTNLDDLSVLGLGLAMHAPSGNRLMEGVIDTFNFDDVIQQVRSWDIRNPASRTTLRSISVGLDAWRVTNVDTSRQRGHAFNRARQVGSIVRKALFK